MYVCAWSIGPLHNYITQFLRFRMIWWNLLKFKSLCVPFVSLIVWKCIVICLWKQTIKLYSNAVYIYLLDFKLGTRCVKWVSIRKYSSWLICIPSHLRSPFDAFLANVLLCCIHIQRPSNNIRFHFVHLPCKKPRT